MELHKKFNPEGSAAAARAIEQPHISQENIAEQARGFVEQAPRSLTSAQRDFTNSLRQIVVNNLEKHDRTMPTNAQALFDKGFRIKDKIPAEVATLQRTREETVRAIREELQAGTIKPKDVFPSSAIAPIECNGQNFSYADLVARAKETLSVSVRGKNIKAILAEGGMSENEITQIIGDLAASVARASSIDRFIGPDMLGVRSSEKPLHIKNQPRITPPSSPKKGTLTDAIEKTGALSVKKPSIDTPERKSVEHREKAYAILGEMAKFSGVETPVRIGGKVRPISFIISPRREFDENDQPIEGGEEWFVIKRAFHVLNTKDADNPKRFEPTNLVREGVANDTTVRTPEDIPEPIMVGLREWGFPDDRNQAFIWMLEGGKAGAAKWKERMEEQKKNETPTE